MFFLNDRASRIFYLSLVLMASKGNAASFGSLQDQSLQSSATICFSVGAQASISGLDDFELLSIDGDGSAGAIYQGSDVFHLESNTRVRILMSGGELQNGDDEIQTVIEIDGVSNPFDTPEDGIHSSEHVLLARAQLERISSQKAGEYNGTITLTIVPTIGEGSGCGESVNGFSSNDGWVTLAYEDLYPNPGDADYNDMVIRYHVAENYNANQELETVTLQFEPLARGAGYNHSFLLSLDGELDNSQNVTTLTRPAFVGDALIKVSYSQNNGNSHVFYNYQPDEDITIFHNTRSTLTGFANVYAGQERMAAKFTTTVDITLANPELNLLSDRGDSSELFYRPFLHVMNTKADIDLAEINSADNMIDANGYPFGIIVPDDWEWPLERVDISSAYPYFSEYQRWLSGESETLSGKAEQWYNYPASSALLYTKD